MPLTTYDGQDLKLVRSYANFLRVNVGLNLINLSYATLSNSHPCTSPLLIFFCYILSWLNSLFRFAGSYVVSVTRIGKKPKLWWNGPSRCVGSILVFPREKAFNLYHPINIIFLVWQALLVLSICPICTNIFYLYLIYYITIYNLNFYISLNRMGNYWLIRHLVGL